MDVNELPKLVNAWFPEFETRFPARFSEAVALPVRFWIVALLYLLDSQQTLRFSIDLDGQPLFAVAELAAAIGVDAKYLAGTAGRWELALRTPYLQEAPTEPGAPPEYWLTFSGLVVTINSLPFGDMVSKDHVGRLARMQGILRAGVLDTMKAGSDDERLGAVFLPKSGTA